MAYFSPDYDGVSSSTKKAPAPSSKRRQHTVSPFYYYCKEFIDECSRNGRRFRNSKQGFEAAALKWNSLSAEEKSQWRDDYKEERKRCIDGGVSEKIKNKNGDRGDPNSDPTDLGVLKDLTLKTKKDINDLKDRWFWLYPDQKAIMKECFLIIGARSDQLFSDTGFTALAVVEFTLADGIVDEYVADFDSKDASGNARYDAIRRVLNWSSKVKRELGGRAPIYFAAPGQMTAVFDALTHVDPWRVDDPSWRQPRSQLSLDRDLANVEDLVDALCIWFGRPKPIDLDDWRNIGDEQCCLSAARRSAQKILDEFSSA